MCWWRSYKPVQRISRRAVGDIWQRNGHLWQNGTGEGHAFQDARGNFEISLRIAAGTAGHVGLIGYRYFGGRRDDGFASRREGGDRDGDHSD